MGAAIKLREDYDADELRRLARLSKDADQSRRLLSLAVIHDGGRRRDAARTGGVGLQVIRDWVLRFNATGPDGLIDRKAPGATSKLDDAQREALAARVDAGPDPVTDGVVRWRLEDLARWIQDEFQISLGERTVSRELKAMGFTKLTARPRHHAQEAGVIDDFKKIPRAGLASPRKPARRRGHRNLVAGRGPRRPEEQDHPALGPTRQPSPRAA